MWQDNVFTPVCHSVHGGGCLLHTPHGQTPLQAHTHTLGRHPPPSASWDTVNKWAVHILLECILVFHINLRTSNFNEWVIIQCIRRFIIQCIRRFIIQFISVYHSVYLIVYHLVYLTVYHSVYLSLSYGLSHLVYLTVYHSVYLSLSYGLSHLVYLTVCHEVYHSVIPQFITGRNEVVAKVMFLHVSVILSTGGVSREKPPGQGDPKTRQTPPGRETPPDQGDPPDQADPPEQGRPPGRENPPGPCRPPPPEADSRIRSTSGRYASYWNAFLLCGLSFTLCHSLSSRLSLGLSSGLSFHLSLSYQPVYLTKERDAITS